MVFFQHIETLGFAIAREVFLHIGTGLGGRIVAGRFLLVHLQLFVGFVDAAKCLLNGLVLPWIRPGRNVLDVNQFVHVIRET